MEERYMKKFISALIVTAMMIPTAVPMTALADNTVNNSVSGYVSIDTGVKLIGKDKQAKIYVDSNDYESVIPASSLLHLKSLSALNINTVGAL